MAWEGHSGQFLVEDCEYCVHDLPQVIATHNKVNSRGFETLAISMSYDAPAYAVGFVRTRMLPFDVAIDLVRAIATQFGNVKFTPVSFMIDKRAPSSSGT